MTQRYKIIDGSPSNHCCFAAAVADTARTSEVTPTDYYIICECFALKDAQKIAQVLNEKTGALQ